MPKYYMAILILFFFSISPFAQNLDSNKTPEQWANQLNTGRYYETDEALYYYYKNPKMAKLAQSQLENFSKTCGIKYLQQSADMILEQIKSEPPKCDPAHIKELIKILKDSKDEKALQPIFDEIAQIGSAAKETAPELIRILNDNPSMAVSDEVSRLLLKIDADVKPVIAGLLQKFQTSQDDKQKKNYAFSIGSFGPAASDAVPALLSALDSPDVQLKSRIILALGYIHSCSEEVVPIIIENLHKGSQPIKQGCCMALANFRPPTKEAIGALILAMQDSTWYIRETAIRSLGLLGEYAEPALPALKLMLKDESSILQNRAAESIKMIEFRKK